MIKLKAFNEKQWVYFKVYINPRVSDILLIKSIGPFASDLLNKGLSKKWFFVRYRDPQPHIRIRFLVPKLNEHENVKKDFKAIMRHFLDVRYVWRIQEYHYERENGRYGKCNIDLVENIFFTQSQLALKLINDYQNHEQLLLTICRIVNSIFNESVFKIEQRNSFVSKQRNYLKSEFDIQKEQEQKISLGYRKISDELYRYILNPSDISIDFDTTVNHLINQTNIFICQIKEQFNKDKSYLLESLIHMFVNKCFYNRQWAFEYLLYEFLDRAYLSFSNRNPIE